MSKKFFQIIRASLFLYSIFALSSSIVLGEESRNVSEYHQKDCSHKNKCMDVKVCEQSGEWCQSQCGSSDECFQRCVLQELSCLKKSCEDCTGTDVCTKAEECLDTQLHCHHHCGHDTWCLDACDKRAYSCIKNHFKEFCKHK